MTHIKLNWESLRFPADGSVTAWKDLKKLAEHRPRLEKMLRSERAVYVIRIVRPFAFKYPKGNSPVIYIGKGGSQSRLRTHLGSWMLELSGVVQNLQFEIRICEPRIQKSGTVCEKVEADLLHRFEEKFGERPLNNTQRPRTWGNFDYDSDGLAALSCGKGRGYHWALSSMGSNPLREI